MSLVMDVRLNKAPTERVDVGMGCGPQCSGTVQVDPR